jgi:hypothetical protein
MATYGKKPFFTKSDGLTLDELEHKIRRRKKYLKRLVVEDNAKRALGIQRQMRHASSSHNTKPHSVASLSHQWANSVMATTTTTTPSSTAAASFSNQAIQQQDKTISDWMGWVAINIISKEDAYYHADPAFQPLLASNIGKFKEKKLFARRLFKLYMYNVRRQDLHPNRPYSAAPAMNEQAVVVIYLPKLRRATAYRVCYVKPNTSFSHTVKRQIKVEYITDSFAASLKDALKLKWRL